MTDDLADIEAFMKQAGVRAVAEAVRARSGELATYQSAQQPEEIHAARLSPDWWTQHRVSTRQVVTTPVEHDAAPSWAMPWYRRRLTRITAGLAAVLAVLGLAIWAVVGVVTAASAAVSAHFGAIQGIAVLLGLVLLCSTLGGRRGGSQFSGTFTGRMR
jgi:hypothetical protein